MRKEEVVSRDPRVVGGAMVFIATRVPVEVLVQHLTTGYFLDDFTGVSREQAIAYLEMTPQAADALTS